VIVVMTAADERLRRINRTKRSFLVMNCETVYHYFINLKNHQFTIVLNSAELNVGGFEYK
jgi:hypothetical protein